MSRSKTWAIDFDGVIHNRANPVEGKRMGPPIDGAKDHLVELRRRKDTILIHSTLALTPSGMKAIEDWMAYYGIPYDYIIEKPAADIYLDDKAVRFTDWASVKTLR